MINLSKKKNAASGIIRQEPKSRRINQEVKNVFVLYVIV